MFTSSSGRIASYLLLAVSWLLSAYRLWRSMNLNLGHHLPDDFLSGLFGRGMDQTLADPQAWQLGYPIAGWSLVFFALIALLLAFNSTFTDKTAFVLNALGIGITSVLSSKMVLGATPICSICIFIFLLSLVLLYTLWLVNKQRINQAAETSPTTKSMDRRLFLLAPVILGIAIESLALWAEPMIQKQRILKSFYAETVLPVPADENAPHTGPASAPAQLVVFSSFQCPACQTFAKYMDAMAKHYGDQLNITFKNYPLSNQCNPGLSSDMQPQSCQAALAALAAHKQGKFWNYHDALFDSDLFYNDEKLAELASNAGLDMEQWEKDLSSPEAQLQIQRDVTLGSQMAVMGTPTVLLNGRKVENKYFPLLSFLVQKEIETSR